MIASRFLALFPALALGFAVSAADARPSVVFDLGTGQVLAQEDALQAWHPASLTKLMTAYVTFRALQAGELTVKSPVKMTKNAAKRPPAKMGYKPGAVMTLDNALKMLLVKSANDIAVAVAENVAGSEANFVARMNAEAVRLGMTGSHFANPNGLDDPANVTTARDMAVLAMAIRREFPEHAHYFSIEALTDGKRILKTYNLLIGRFDGADGMKTGYICASGFNMVGSATRDGRTVIAVVLGEKDGLKRTEKAAELLAKGFMADPRSGTPLAALSGASPSMAPDLRETQCPKPVKPPPGAKPAKPAGSEAVEKPKLNSPWLHELQRELVAVKVGLGGAVGQPVAIEEPAKPVPVPTPRPEPAVKAADNRGAAQ
ncbi:MAG: D-alanyl-D-alanine carboxypeptidase [Phyllobacteriaceae bacterium]|nr:D-alanyl-D-alanine carboxypeptidase [Phyllobacteriaceae bacterium]